MPASTRTVALDTFTTFGDLLRYLRRRTGLTQIELSIAVGYSHAQISRLEQNQRLPDRATVAARFVPALDLKDEPDVVARLLELAGPAGVFTRPGDDHPAPRHNLPIQLTSFVGRELEIAEVKRLLARSPLVTLTGAGGCGKTRLALQVAAALTERVAQYADGIWLVELAPVSDPALVPQKLAAALDVREALSQPLVTTLANHLREKCVLLVLDNCEHLIEACAQLAETLLQACPSLRILATSREVLGLAGETIWRVPPLALPPIGPQPLPPIEDIAQYEAVRLFIDRAVTTLPGFAVTPQNAPALAEVCDRLDGMPLAIELAAARVGMLRVEQIAARLDDRFKLLTRGSRAMRTRHQTLQAAIDWSYELLSEAERTLLSRLAVFVGGWTLEAAEAVGVGDGIEAGAVLDLLTQLVNKSLVVAQRELGQETRYRLLETIREYAVQRLIESVEVEAIQRRHASFFLVLTETVKPNNANWSVWLKHFVREHDNLRAALDWAFENAPDLGLQLAEALGPFWFNSGYLSEGRGHLMRALELTKVIGSPQTRAEVLHGAGSLAWQQGDYAAAQHFYEESATLSQEIGYKPRLAGTLTLLGRMMAVLHGPHSAARSLQEEGVAICRELGDKVLLAPALYYLGASVAAQGDEVMAHSLLEESAALYRNMGDRSNIAVPLGYLAYQALRQGDYTAARSLFSESLAMARGWHKWGVAWRLEGFAGLAAKEEEPKRAARLYGAAQVLLDSVGARLDPIDRLGYDQYVAIAREQLGDAAFAQAWAEGRAMTMEQAIDLALDKTVSA